MQNPVTQDINLILICHTHGITLSMFLQIHYCFQSQYKIIVSDN